MRRVIFVNRYYCPDYSATSQLLTDLCEHLAMIGLRVCVITSRQSYDNACANLKVNEVINNVHVHRIWTSRFGRQNLPLRCVDYATFYLSAFVCCVTKAHAGDVLVTMTDPPLISVVNWIAARVKRVKLVNWIQDLFPEVALGAGMTQFKFLFPPVRLFRNLSLRGAAVNVAIGEKMAQLIRVESLGRSNVAVIHNWADGASIRPLPGSDNPLRRAWGLENKFVVTYSGNIGRVHEFKTIIGAIDALRDVKDVCFLIIGEGAQKRRFVEMLELKNKQSVRVIPELKGEVLANVVFMPYQPRELLGQSLTVGDVHLVSLLPSMEGLVVPSKFYGIAAAGRPTLFVGDIDGEIARILRGEVCEGGVNNESVDSRVDHRCGISVGVGDVKGLMDAILKLKDDPALTAKMGENARKVFDRRFSKDVALRAWEKLLREVVL